MGQDELTALVSRAEAAQAEHRLADGLAAARAAWAMARRDDGALQRRAGVLLLHFLHRTGAASAVVDLAHDVLPLLRAAGPTTELIDQLRTVSIAGSDAQRFDVALASAQEALRLATDIDDTARISLTTNALGCFFERCGDPWQAERLMIESLALARGQPDPMPVFIALNNLSANLIGKFYLLRDAVPLDEAREPLRAVLPHAREAAAMASRFGDPRMQVFATGNLGEVLVNLGDAAAAHDALQAALAGARDGGYEAQVWRIGCSMGELHLLEGRPQQAADTLAAVLDACAGAEQRVTHLRLHHALWRAWRALGDHRRALSHFESYMSIERQRSMAQLAAQSRLFVTRIEAEQARKEALRHRARAHELEADVLRDPLTGLGNRRELARRWPELLQQVIGDSAPLSVAMLDIDHFKQVNDHHGHTVGDRVLVVMAGLLRDHTRSADLVARTGGEEFLLVLHDTGAERAHEVCERLRQQVAAHPWHVLAPGLQVTLSMGLTSAPPFDAEALTTRADDALYRAKTGGRNRLVQG